MRQATRKLCPESRYPLAGCLADRPRAPIRKRYEIKASSPKLFDAIANARWRSIRLVHIAKARSSAQAALPDDNIAAITLLDSWLTKEPQERDEAWERFERSLDENRFSSRKFST
jgi:hypothetical protein